MMMMTVIYHESDLSDDLRRPLLYAGDLFVFTPRPSTLELIKHAREMIEGVFGDDPTHAQFGMAVEKFVELGGPLKPAFIHHPRTKELIRDVVADIGCSLEDTYLDVPRLRLATSNGYLTAGVGYAFHPHRDTWYSAPMAQLNWWIPIYDFGPDAGMAFHPHYMDEPIKNGSAGFNYYRWNADGRKNASQHIKTDTRVQPKPEQDIQLDPQIRIMGKAGSVLIFSAAHLHSTVPNTSGATRFSIDFRTVNVADVKAQGGAKNIDSDCTGTSLRDFVRGTDLQRMPEEIVSLYDDGSAGDGIAVFTPDVHQLADGAKAA
jgi:hypothetical protein